MNNTLMPQMIDAIVFEANLQKKYLLEPVETIYVGGGTPSLLSNDQLMNLVDGIKANFKLSDNIEVTLEANPDDITPEKLRFWKLVGINRLSMGVQSFFEEDLRWMNRAHDAQQAIQSIEMAQAAGFDNISIDLIYGGPTLTDAHWEKNLEICFNLSIPHLSAYALTVEPKTVLAKKINSRELTDVDPEKQAHHFNLLVALTERAGFEQYEISNFAMEGKKSKHNANYWLGKHYLGLGPAAHSFNGSSRQWNIANNSLYVSSIHQQTIPFEVELLTPTQQLNEYIMTALRTSAGIHLKQIEILGGAIAVDQIQEDAKPFILNGKILPLKEKLILTKEGKFFADGIAAALFQD